MLDDICGATDAERQRLDHESVWEHLTRLTGRAVRKWRTALEASPDPRARALSFALSNSDLPPPSFSEEGYLLNEPSKDTVPNNSLILLALETNDPAIYALALGQCRTLTGQMAPGPCQGLSFAHWSRVDPDNAAPWMQLAVRAQQAGDTQGTDAALAKAAQATRFDGYSSMILAVGLNMLPPGMTPSEKAAAYTKLQMVGWLVPPLRIVALCEGPNLEIGNRRAACTAITQHLAEQGSTVIDVAIASILAQRLDWPADQRAKLDTEKRALVAAVTAANPNLDPGEYQSFDCQRVDQMTRRLDATIAARGNERATLRMLSGVKEAGDTHW